MQQSRYLSSEQNELRKLFALQERCGLKGRDRADFDEAMDYNRCRAEQRALGIQETNEAAIKRFREGR